MAPVVESIYFPSLGHCLDGDELLISWKTAFLGLISYTARSSPAVSALPRRQELSLERFLSDSTTTSLLIRPYQSFHAPTPQTRAAFETRTAAINVTPHPQGRYKLEELIDDALWLSREAKIDEVSALRIVLLEWQSRPAKQLLLGFADEELASLEDVAGGASWTSALSFNQSTLSSRPSTDATVFTAPSPRRIRILQQYLSERRYILKVSELLLLSSVARADTRPSAARGDPAWPERIGKTIINARVAGKSAEAHQKPFVVECVDALQERLVGLEQGSGWFKDDPRPELDAEWGSSLLLELVHLLQIIYLVLDSLDGMTSSTVALVWLRFVSKYAFFDTFQPPFDAQQPLVVPFKSLIAVNTVTMLKLPFSLERLLDAIEHRASPSAATSPSFVEDTAALLEMHELFLSAASACWTTACPAVFAWGILLQTMRELVLSRREATELRQSQRAVESMANVDTSETEAGDSSATETGPSLPARAAYFGRRAAGSDASLELSLYDDVLDRILDASPGDDPIAYLARSAVDGSHVFDVIEDLATGFCATRDDGVDNAGEMGVRMRLVLLELIRCSLEWVEYLPEVVSATLAVLTGGEDVHAAGRLEAPTTAGLDLAEVFLKDHVLLVPKMLNVAYARFPYEPLPFLKLVRALGHATPPPDLPIPPMLAMLESMTTFTQALPRQFRGYDTTREEENVNQIILITELPLFAERTLVRPLLLPARTDEHAMILLSDVRDRDGAIIPRDVRGRVLLESSPPVVQWEYEYSALRYLGRLLHAALPTGDRVESATGQPPERETVIEIITLFATLLAAGDAESGQRMLADASDGLGRDCDVVSIIFELFESEVQQEPSSSSPTGATDLLLSCIHFIHALIPSLPGKVWPLLARSSLLESETSGGRLGTIIASTEMVTGRFGFLLGCVRVYEALVQDAVTNAVVRKRGRKMAGRFAAPDEHGTGVPEKLVQQVLVALSRAMVDVVESSSAWRFAAIDEGLDLETRILSVFDTILRVSYGIDDSPDLRQKVTGPLAFAATYLVEVFLATSAKNLPILPILRIFHDGIRTPDTTLLLRMLHLWTARVRVALGFTTTLLRIRTLRDLPAPYLVAQLLKATPLLARVYVAHQSYQRPVIHLLETITVNVGRDEAQPPPLLGHLGADSAKHFLRVLSRLDRPHDDDDLDVGIWHLLAAVVSGRQQWLAVYVLTGETPRESLHRKKSGAPPRTLAEKPMLRIALDAMNDLPSMPVTRALAMLEFIRHAQDHWPWATADLQTHPTFLTVISDFLGALDADQEVLQLHPTMATPCKIRMAAYVADILAMSLHHGRQRMDVSLARKLLPKISYLVDRAVLTPAYNNSLHGNLRRNFEDRFSGCKLPQFKHTQLRRRPFGPNYFYDLDVASRMLSFDRVWRGIKGEGLAGEFERANQNLSIVESQVALLRSWKLLAVELTNCLPGDTGLQKSVAKMIADCLVSNANTMFPEAIFKDLVQFRGDFAFVLMQKLAEAKSRLPEVTALLGTTWSSIRSSGTNFELALSGGDIGYFRSLLRLLFLGLRAQWDPAGATTDANASTTTSRLQQSSPETLETVLSILDVVVTRGFRDLVAAAHERPADSSPEDLALVTAILQSSLCVPGIDLLYPQICTHMAQQGVARVATTLFSWSDQLTISGDPVYGELAVFMLVELALIPGLAEQLAVDGMMTQLSSARIMTHFQRGVSPLDPNQRLLSIWTRGILPLCLNLLTGIGPVVTRDVGAFLNQYSAQLSLASTHFDNKATPTISSSSTLTSTTAPSTFTSPPTYLTLNMASEVHSLALIHRILVDLTPDTPPQLAWDAAVVREDIEFWLHQPGGRRALRERIVPTSEAERDMARSKPPSSSSSSSGTNVSSSGGSSREGTSIGYESLLEEKIVREMLATERLLEVDSASPSSTASSTGANLGASTSASSATPAASRGGSAGVAGAGGGSRGSSLRRHGSLKMHAMSRSPEGSASFARRRGD
ncbi:MAG: hypothetical protein M1838_004557 [Thelocarpon superellum]|nr:MAG: hypothetical protein M1838_004557 [Thelocarpon superellum]